MPIMRISKRFAARILVLTTMLLADTVVARAGDDFLSDLNFDSVAVGGFFSQGYLYGSDASYPTSDRGGTWDFRSLAVNVSSPIGSHLRVGAQAFAESFGNLGDDRLTLDWAQLDYNFRQEFGIRVGRVKYPQGLYGEALDLDSTRPFVMLPVAIYNPVLREFSAAFNGAMVYGTVNIGSSSLDYKAFYGGIPMGPQSGASQFYQSAGFYAGDKLTGMAMEHVAGAQLTWNTPVQGLRVMESYSYYHDLTTDGPFYAVPSINLHTVIQHLYWSTASVEYTPGDWTFAAEWLRNGGTDLDGYAPPVVKLLVDPVGWNAWYVSAARRFAKKFEAGAYYSSLHTRFPGGGNGGQPDTYRHDLVASLRYDFSEHLLFKVEADDVQGLYQMFNTPLIPNPKFTSDRTTVFAFKSTFSF